MVCLQLLFCAILLVGSSVQVAAQSSDTPIDKVHIIFMNHLDVGYNGISPEIGFINNVINKYFVEYFRRAALVAKALVDGGYQETFRYTTHPWLVKLYLDCPPDMILSGVKLKCPNATEIADFEKAVSAGYITWHAGAMNLQTDNVDAWLLQRSLNISINLDQRLGVERKMRVMSQRDVPGITAAVLPSLLHMGISAVSVGVNSMTSPPAVPKLFTWKYNGQSVLAAWHPGGYPNNAGADPKHPGGLSRDDCATFPGFSEALCFAFRTDNSGPPMDAQEVLGYYEVLRVEFPGARLFASSLEDFFAAVEPIASQLPVVEKEIGDTWIQGIATDPRKQAEYRAVSRCIKACLLDGRCSYSDPRIVNATFLLSKLPEHTWGLSGVYDNVNWTNLAFKQAKTGANYVNVTKSWSEQRSMTYLSVDALGNHSVVTDIWKAWQDLQTKRPNLDDYEVVETSDWSKEISCPKGAKLAISPTGAITTLSVNGVNYASSEYPMSQFKYNTYNEGDFAWFGSLYNYNGYSAGYQKVNATRNAHPESRDWPAVMNEMYQAKGNPCDVYVHLTMVEEEAWQYYGAAQDVWIHYSMDQQGGPGVNVEVQLFDKSATRLAESLSVIFQAVPQEQHKWQLSKLGERIDPNNINLNGSQYVHGLDDNGVFYVDASSSSKGLQFSSPDVPVAVVMTTKRTSASVFSAPLVQHNDTVTGVAFNIFNNIWDTNYILWYPYLPEDAAFKARFRISVLDGGSNEAQQNELEQNGIGDFMKRKAQKPLRPVGDNMIDKKKIMKTTEEEKDIQIEIL